MIASCLPGTNPPVTITWSQDDHPQEAIPSVIIEIIKGRPTMYQVILHKVMPQEYLHYRIISTSLSMTAHIEAKTCQDC